MESKKIKKKERKNRLLEPETKGIVTRREGVEERVKLMKGNAANNIVVSLHGLISLTDD